MSKKITVSPEVLALNPEIAKSLQSGFSLNRDQIVVPGEPKFDSGLERRAWYEWALALKGDTPVYHPFSLYLHVEGVKVRRYTPDIVVYRPVACGDFMLPAMTLVEVKPSWKSHPSGRLSKANVVHASVEYAWMGQWLVLMPDGPGWQTIQVIGGTFVNCNV